MDVGATLQSARERRGLSLEELAQRTKINVRVLRAMENNAFERVPPGIFTRGFLRAYAREVGLDPAATVAQFLAGLEVDTQAGPPANSRAHGSHADDLLVVKGYGAYGLPSETRSEAWKAIAIAVVSLGFVAYLSLGTPGDAVTEAPPVADVEVAPAPSQAPDVLLASDPARPVATAGETFDVEIRPTGPCWVEAMVDGNRRVYDLMQAGARESLTVHDGLVLRVGNPAAFAFSINGRPGRLPGRPGQPVTIRIDADNFTDFLAPTSD